MWVKNLLKGRKGRNFMETIRVNMAPITPEIPDIVRPSFINNSFMGNAVSRWRDLEDELGYYLDTEGYLEEPTCYEELLL